MEYLFAYIHLNPVKLIESNWKEIGIMNTEKVREFLNSYKYSSYFDYMGIDREDRIILEKGSFPEYFMTPKEHKDFVDFWLNSEEIIKDRP